MVKRVWNKGISLLFCGLLIWTGWSQAAEKASVLQFIFMTKELFPGTEKIGVLIDKNDPQKASLLEKLNRAGVANQVKIVVAEISDNTDVIQKFKSLIREYNIQVLMVLQEGGLFQDKVVRGYLVKNSVLQKVPLVGPTPQWVEEGACFSVSIEAGSLKLHVHPRTAEIFGLQVPEKYAGRTQFAAN